MKTDRQNLCRAGFVLALLVACALLMRWGPAVGPRMLQLVFRLLRPAPASPECPEIIEHARARPPSDEDQESQLMPLFRKAQLDATSRSDRDASGSGEPGGAALSPEQFRASFSGPRSDRSLIPVGDLKGPASPFRP